MLCKRIFLSFRWIIKSACLFLFMGGVIYSQTTVTPLLTLQAPGTIDQDDMCVWIHPDPSQSTIITSDKLAYKVFVYNLNGDTLQTISVPGKPGNIDVRYNFNLSGQYVDIVGYNDRDNQTIVLFKVELSTRTLTQVGNFDAGNWPNSIYGFCLYNNPITGKFYAIASGKDSQMRQWELVDNGDSTIIGIEKRTWYNSTGDLTEGLVVDDESAKLYAANEGEGVYKYDADPIDPNPLGQLIAPVGSNGLTADVEGISLYYAANGEGYLLVSSQGSDNFKVYERKEPHNFVSTIIVNGASNTDGIDVTNVNLGSEFPRGIFLSHNGSSAVLVSDYGDLGLLVDTIYWNPRNNLPVPVELTSFNATLNESKVILTWETVTESNNLGFEVERKIATINSNGWLKIGFQEGNGTTTELQSYSFIDDISTIEANTLKYRLKQIDYDGTFEYSDIIEVEVGLPEGFRLEQNYPNPFNPSTIIEYAIGSERFVSLKIFDVLGNEVATLVNEEKPAGVYEVEFSAKGGDAWDLPSGVYFYKLRAGSPEGQVFIQTNKMVLLR